MKILLLIIFFFTLVSADDTLTVWKSPTCKCCNEWIKHLEKNGIKVLKSNTGNLKISKKLNINRKFSSCHTALIDGYVIEGHVPFQDIKKLLKEKPQNAIGLSVPGMPIGSPGMDNPIYGKKEPFNVLLLKKDGISSEIFSEYQ